MKRMEKIFRLSIITVIACTWVHVFCAPVQAFEAGSFRLLSMSKSEKLILVSRIPDQRKFLLDATDVKVAINDQPAEFEELASFTIVQVQMDLGRARRKGINLDGRAIEIAVSDPTEKQGE